MLISPSPVLLLVPLAGLLLISGPVTPRAWRWTLVSVVLAAIWLGITQGIVDQVANAMAILMTGGFVVLSTSDRRGVFARASLAVLLALAGVAIWCGIWGIEWGDLRIALTREWWSVWRDLAANPRFGPRSLDARDLLERIADAGASMARLYPARLLLSGMLGLVITANWVEAATGKSVGRAAERLGKFRFTDHLVWLVILAVLVLLLPSLGVVHRMADRYPVVDLMLYTVQYWSTAAENVLVVCAALYAVRGAAVLSRFLRPGAAVFVIVIATVFLLPFALAGLVLLGLADTWIDFRRPRESVAK
ncbi:MAG: hypothetical protein ABI836_00840 [Gemmatimonadota bacterium]